MTIRIPLRVLLFVLYTAAVLGGAFGISYAVFEWREDDGGSADGLTLESLDGEIGRLDGRVGNLSNRVDTLEGSRIGSTDSSQCHRVLLEFTMKVAEGIKLGPSPSLEEAIRNILTDYNLYC